jgi:hypothetical protein
MLSFIGLIYKHYGFFGSAEIRDNGKNIRGALAQLFSAPAFAAVLIFHSIHNGNFCRADFIQQMFFPICASIVLFM